MPHIRRVSEENQSQRVSKSGSELLVNLVKNQTLFESLCPSDLPWRRFTALLKGVEQWLVHCCVDVATLESKSKTI